MEQEEAEIDEESQAEAETSEETKIEADSQAEATLTPQPEPEPVITPQPEPEPESLQPEMELTVDDIISAYEQEGGMADSKLGGKIMKVTGKIDRIEVKETFDIYYITLASEGRPISQSVRCNFDQKHGAELSNLMQGQTVTVQGKYDGSLIDLSIRNCILISK